MTSEPQGGRQLPPKLFCIIYTFALANVLTLCFITYMETTTTTHATPLCQFEAQQEPRTATCPQLAPLPGQQWTGVREQDHGNHFDVFAGAPCQWSADRGATHTLWLGEGMAEGSRPARLLKTVMWVGVDEDADGGLVWEKWAVRHTGNKDAVQPVNPALRAYLDSL